MGTVASMTPLPVLLREHAQSRRASAEAASQRSGGLPKADRVRGLQDLLLKRHSGEQAARPAAPSMLWSLAEGVVPEPEDGAELASAALQQVILLRSRSWEV